MNEEHIRKARAVAARIIDQRQARIIVRPYEDDAGFWFGGGNLIEDGQGTLYLVGRYRNRGDSRTGLEKGARGLELAVMKSADRGRSFETVCTFSKQDLSTAGAEVLSIEGAALHRSSAGVELYVSTEKAGVAYPQSVASFQKPGTGVWSIDLLTAGSVEELCRAPVRPLLSSETPEYLHIKDPVIHETAAGDTLLVFCHHPFNWSSSNSGFCLRGKGEEGFSAPVFSFFPRGTTWDVAVSRITDLLSLPAELLGTEEPLQLIFYDGAECMRPHDQNPMGVKRPRGYSCEEIAGLAACEGDRIGELRRISTRFPLFTSPWGTGSSRYTQTLLSEEGVFAAWQQSQPSGAQPLVMSFVSWDELRRAAAEA